jgi:hypothetical protein
VLAVAVAVLIRVIQVDLGELAVVVQEIMEPVLELAEQ